MSRLVMFQRTVRSLSTATSVPRAMMRILPCSTRSTANGADAQPTSICLLMVAVSVPGMPPVAVGLAVT